MVILVYSHTPYTMCGIPRSREGREKILNLGKKLVRSISKGDTSDAEINMTHYFQSNSERRKHRLPSNPNKDLK